MNDRERYIATLTFKKPERIPFAPGNGRESTRKRWHEEGLPEGRDPIEYVREVLGFPIKAPAVEQESLAINFRLIPIFEEKIMEHRNHHYVVQDWKGNICEISDEFSVRHLREAIDFVTRRWIKCPVESREDWMDMKKRYDIDAPGRFPEDFSARCRRLRDRDWPLTVSVSGPFWQMREWCGFEGLCMLMLEDPDFVMEMADFWRIFVSRMLERVLNEIVPDSFFMSEDMAYKAKSMISMDMARKFCMPAWTEWSHLVKKAGTPLVDMDSDGFIGELIPLWIESGINVCDPIEVAAHCDLIEFRHQFGHDMAYRQGVDKRCIAAGGPTLDAELRRIEPVVRDGGYIPGCDHGVPHDVSWKNFMEYCASLAELGGWK